MTGKGGVAGQAGCPGVIIWSPPAPTHRHDLPQSGDVGHGTIAHCATCRKVFVRTLNGDGYPAWRHMRWWRFISRRRMRNALRSRARH